MEGASDVVCAERVVARKTGSLGGLRKRGSHFDWRDCVVDFVFVVVAVAVVVVEEKLESDLRDRFDWRLCSSSREVSLQMRKSGVGVVSLRGL